jgi:hypothetical protein
MLDLSCFWISYCCPAALDAAALLRATMGNPKAASLPQP